MIDRYDYNKIGECIINDIPFYFYLDDKIEEEEERITRFILSKTENQKQVAKILIEQLHNELSKVCRTELVKEVFIDVYDVYYENRDPDEINMSFFTDYVIETIPKPLDVTYGFYCDCTLGRYSRKNKEFREVSNNMLSKCEVM